MNVPELLDRAEDTPLGPLTLKAVSDGPDAWWLSLTLGGAPPVSVRLVYEAAHSVVRLERQILSQVPFERWQAALDSRSWLTEASPIAGGGVAVRLWLSAFDLQLNTLLTAATDLARLEKLAATSSATVAPRATTTARPVSWATMGSPAEPPAPAQPTPPEPAAPAAAPNGSGNYCKECGTMRPANHTFCTNCGAQMN